MKWGEPILLQHVSDVPMTTSDLAVILFPDVKNIAQEHRAKTHRHMCALEKKGLVVSRVIHTESHINRYWVKAGCTAKLDEMLDCDWEQDILVYVSEDWKTTAQIFQEMHGRPPTHKERERTNRRLHRLVEEQAVTNRFLGHNEWRLTA